MVDEAALLSYMRERAYRPMTMDELYVVFEVISNEDRENLQLLFADLEDRGKIVRTRTDRYGLPERMDLVVGRLQVKARGFGFVVPLEDGAPDVYISASDLGGAMDGDMVLARQRKIPGVLRKEGEIIRVTKRAHRAVVGLLTTHAGYGFVQPDDKHLNQDIFIPGDGLNGAVDGHKVVVEITEYAGNGVQSAAGRVVEILGFPGDPGVDILSIVRKYGIPETFPQEVLQAAEAIPHEVNAEEIKLRRDLRDETIVTIDGADAKDLDDAVHVRVLDNGNYLLGVHIADVSYYVKEGSLLDKEAFARGTSVYLVDRVIPMLPPRLSNGICSLNPRVDRLTLTCEMEWTPNFQLERHDIYPSVIRTTERMTYDEVRGILTDTDQEARERYRDLIPNFELMQKLALGLRERRVHRGAVDFDFAETKIRVDEFGKPTELVKRERTIAEMIIEEFMLAANETVAEHFYWMEVPFLYRVHEPPTIEKMIALNEFVHNFGYHLKAAGNIHPRALQDLLGKVQGGPEGVVISHVMLRSLKQARYSQEALGHFGLAAAYYSHFTSPIRRYPDLMIHRIIREVVVGGGLSGSRHEKLTARMPEIAAQCSERERNAVDAERETDLVKKIEYMMDKVGQEFEGMISGVTGFGLFIQLDNSVEGLIHVSYLEDDYYHYHENLHALIGERLGRTFRIGDRVRVQLLAASKEQLSIDFRLVESFGSDISFVDDFDQGGRPGYAGRSSGRRPDGSSRQAADGQGRGRSGGGKQSGYGGRSGPGEQLESGGSSRGGGRGRSGAGTRQVGGRSGDGSASARQGGSRQFGGDGQYRSGGSSSATGSRSIDDGGKRGEGSGGADMRGAERDYLTGGRKMELTTGRKKRGSLLPSTGGYQAVAADSKEAVREQRRKDKQVLKDISEAYGVQVKDKSRRKRKQNNHTV